MKSAALVAVAIALFIAPLVAQETKPVPKGSRRVTIPGCSKGLIFTVSPRTVDEAGSDDIPAGMHLRMSGPKKLIAEIKAHEGSKIALTGLMKAQQYGPTGIGIGGVRITPGLGPAGGSVAVGPTAGQVIIDVEGWRPAVGDCFLP